MLHHQKQFPSAWFFASVVRITFAHNGNEKVNTLTYSRLIDFPMSPEDVAAQLVNSSYLKFVILFYQSLFIFLVAQILSFHIIASSAGIVALLHLYWRRK